MPLTVASLLLQTVPWVSLDVRRGSIVDISIPIPSIAEQQGHDPHECLLWQFLIHEYDVGFQLLENEAVIQDLGRFRASENEANESKSNDSSMSHHAHSLDALEPTMEGKFDSLRPDSVYTLRWDNVHSLMRHKQVQYRFLVTSNRVVAAAELAVQESQLHLQQRAKRAAAGLPLPHLSKKLEQERALCDEKRKEQHGKLVARLEQTVMDLVSIFMTRPDSPLHEGAIRPFIIAFETVLCNGIKERYLDNWPEAPFYEFLLETQHVLRDDMGIVLEIQQGEPPPNLRYLGWNKSRAFLLLALNKGLLQRAFENLSKRRLIIDKYYETKALLSQYEDAREIAAFLSALNGVTFLLAPYPPDIVSEAALVQFPRNLKQWAPEAPLIGNEISFPHEMEGDSCVVKYQKKDTDEIKQLEKCTVPRFILYGEPFQDVVIGRSSFKLLSITSIPTACIIVAQLRVDTQDILISFATHDGHELSNSLCLSATDEWIEIVVRFESRPVVDLALKLDNSYSMVRSKQVQIRYQFVDAHAYAMAWESCLEMAQAISWNHASRLGSERCANYMTSLHLKEETEVNLHRKQGGSDCVEKYDDSILGLRTSLLSKPVSYIVGGFLSSEGTDEACDECLNPFSFFSRQHECPCCKKIVCIQCSRHVVQVSGKNVHLKVCDRCFIIEKDKERIRIASLADKSDKRAERLEYTALRKEPAMEKYFKMLSFGVPSSGVTQKMMQDNVPHEKIAIFAAGPDGHPGLTQTTSQVKQSGSRRIDRRDSTFRKVYWTSLDSERANETIWARVTARRKTAPITLSPQDFQELKCLFGSSAAGLPSQISDKAKKKTKFSALDSRRSNNIMIGLSQFKAAGGADGILSALKTCDFELLTIDRLTTLQDIAPNSVEVKRYTNFKGSRSRLEAAEKFLVEMCEISRVTEKINAMLFVSQFNRQQEELRNRTQLITRACYEVLQSERLARCFELILAIGNLLNTGTELEGAQGITLASLLKLSETKAVDKSMTLLHFIIQLIHNRGEGDVLLFIHDLKSLPEARRYSNVICDSQTRALQLEITKLEQEIKEEMVENLKQFNEAEALRKRQHEKRAQTYEGKGALQSNVTLNSTQGVSLKSRSTILDAIRHRGASQVIGREALPEDSEQTSNNAAMTEIQCRTDLLSQDQRSLNANVTTRTSEIKNKRFEVRSNAQRSPASVNKAALLHALRNRSTKISEDSNLGEQKLAHEGEAGQVLSARSSLFASIRQRGEPICKPEGGSTLSRSSFLASIQQHRRHVSEGRSSAEVQNTLSSKSSESRAVFGQTELDVIDASSIKANETFVPRQYEIESKFILVMREQLMNIKAAFEDIEMELEALHVAWDATARYLAEDSSGSSTEYVFGLLNRFLLDVKVAKTLLSRKGFTFTNGSNALLPRAHVGNVVATNFGSGIITAFRMNDKRIEVKFPWNREAYLSFSSILSAGSLVRCQPWGVGIIRDTFYDIGFCDVRFSFGYGKVRVKDIVLETSSNKEELRLEVLRCGYFMGDPVVTPFGCGNVQSLRGNPQSSTAVLSVGVLDSDCYGCQRHCTAVAFVPANRVQRCY